MHAPPLRARLPSVAFSSARQLSPIWPFYRLHLSGTMIYIHHTRLSCVSPLLTLLHAAYLPLARHVFRVSLGVRSLGLTSVLIQAASRRTTQFYAPRPQGPPTHFYPPSNENALQVPPLHPSPSPSRTSDDHSVGGYKEGRIGVDYRDVTRTPSPTPSEAEALVNKTRSFNLKKYFDPSYFKDPRNLSAFIIPNARPQLMLTKLVVSFIITVLIIGLLIAFAIEQNNIIKALRPVAKWMRE